MKSPAIFVMLLLIVTATAADGETTAANTPARVKITEAPKIQNGTAESENERAPPAEERGDRDRQEERVNPDNERPRVETEVQEPVPNPPAGNEAVNEDGSPLGEATSITSGVNMIGGFTAFAAALTYLF